MTNAQQFEAFMRSHQNMVFSTAMRLLASQSEAEDVTQEVFLKAFEHFDRIGDSPAAAGWLRTVATHLCLNHLSRYRKRWSFFSELGPRDADEGAEVEFASEENMHESLDRSERCKLAERALQSLPAPQRVPLVLFHLEGLSYTEIAEKLGVSLGKVKTDIFRGRETLRQKLRLQLEENVI